ncbi:MAG: peptidylprolyl isomerase [Chitinophagaceae bacterium]
MKTIILPVIFFIASLGSGKTQAQSLIRLGKTNISKEEFVKAFRKNNTDPVITEQSIRAYLELFIRFKLKVKAAHDAGLDSLPAQKAELRDFTSQLAASYTVDEKSFEGLVNEAIERSKKDIHLAHIFIPFPVLPGKKEGDTAYASRQAQVAFDLLSKGSEFGKVAADFSADTATQLKKGDLGYITVFTLPYPFETIAYTTLPGTFSKPFKSTIGYHILKNLGERKAAGRISVAQILLAFEPNPSDSMVKALSTRADSIHTALQNGASFNEMVARYSNDNTSIGAHGELPAFAPGTYSPDFEHAAFALTADGETSKPFMTAFGFHILKRLRVSANEIDRGADSSLSDIKDKIKRDERMQLSRQAMLKNIYASINFRAAAFDKNAFISMSDSTLQNPTYSGSKKLNRQSVLFITGSQKRSMNEWLKYLLDVQNISSLSMGKSITDLYQQFQDNAALGYYRDHLEQYNRNYADQVNEFKEGNLLFEMMQRTIWDKAAKDSAGLRKFFRTRKTNYTWEPSADAIIFNAVDSISAFALWNELIKTGTKDWRNTLLSYLDKAQADSGRYELSQLPVGAGTLSGPTRERVSKPVKNSGDSKVFSFVYIIKQHPEKALKSFEEAQGAVLNDYQQNLEEKWIARLKLKYPIVVNQVSLKSLW